MSSEFKKIEELRRQPAIFVIADMFVSRKLLVSPSHLETFKDLAANSETCFQLTALISGLMAKLWCQKIDPVFLHILISIGPLVEFEGLLSYYGDEIDMWGDMVVAVEDLATVNFTLAATKIK